MMPAPTPLGTAEIQALRNGCTRWLQGHRPLRSMRESLLRLAELPEAAQALDLYGEGEAIQALETELAALLGKPAARFFHKGVAAQLAAVQTWLERTPGHSGFELGLHRQSHLELDEALAYERLMRWRGLRLGEANAPQTVAELRALPEVPRVLIVELPLRRAGFLLPDWDELCAISAWCRAQGVVLHFDGARLWEAAAHYGRPLAEIAALADSVYLSFYKGLGGLAGSVLVGPADFIAGSAPWQSRLAGNLYTVYPMVLSALDGLRRHLPRMAAYRERARALATGLAELPGARVWPCPPQTNSFQLHLPVAPERLRAALIDFARREGVWLGARAATSIWPDHSMVEIVLGDAADDWTDAEARAWWQAVLAQASA